jgi:homopolymeric O-antigen transport system permease protein
LAPSKKTPPQLTADLSRAVKIIRPPTFSLPTMAAGLQTLTHYSDLLYTMTMLRLSVRYKQSVLGWLWAVLQPLALMISYTAIFSRVAKVPSEGTPYPVFVLTALLPWVFFSSAISNATIGIVNYGNLVMKVYFPREIIPLSYIAAALFDFCIASFMLGFLMLYYKVALTWNALYALPIFGIFIAFTTAISLVVSAVQVRLRDVSMAIPLVLQVWMFATPVVYPLQSVPANIRRIYLMNPTAVLIDNFRRVLLHGDSPNGALLGLASAITILTIVLAYITFKTLEATMADFI